MARARQFTHSGPGSSTRCGWQGGNVMTNEDVQRLLEAVKAMDAVRALRRHAIHRNAARRVRPSALRRRRPRVHYSPAGYRYVFAGPNERPF